MTKCARSERSTWHISEAEGMNRWQKNTASVFRRFVTLLLIEAINGYCEDEMDQIALISKTISDLMTLREQLIAERNAKRINEDQLPLQFPAIIEPAETKPDWSKA